jgi:hypothetical protein
MQRTYLAPEEHAYPNGGQTRRCRAICADGKVRVVYAGIPDTYFSIPAHRNGRTYERGILMMQTDSDKPDFGELLFHVYPKS